MYTYCKPACLKVCRGQVPCCVMRWNNNSNNKHKQQLLIRMKQLFYALGAALEIHGGHMLFYGCPHKHLCSKAKRGQLSA